MDLCSCAFTGHRPKSLPWRYNESSPDCTMLKDVLAEQIKTLADDGVTGFISGMAQGVDLWAAQIVLDLRKKNPAIKLCCALPCDNQEIKWSSSVRTQYHSILEPANKIVRTGHEYTKKCMLDRNRYMVDHAGILLAVYNGSYQSGTGMTVRYAQSKKRKIIVIDPITREVSRINEELRI